MEGKNLISGFLDSLVIAVILAAILTIFINFCIDGLYKNKLIDVGFLINNIGLVDGVSFVVSFLLFFGISTKDLWEI